jgi:hypothetical protein
MLELLSTLWVLVVGVLSSVWALVMVLLTFGGDLLYILHVDMPRFEGLLVGVLLAWLMMRRDSHPVLRVLSAPLKLIVDVLDLAWDQFVEIVDDLWDTLKRWTLGPLGWCKDRVAGLWSRVMSGLTALKERLSRK